MSEDMRTAACETTPIDDAESPYRRWGDAIVDVRTGTLLEHDEVPPDFEITDTATAAHALHARRSAMVRLQAVRRGLQEELDIVRGQWAQEVLCAEAVATYFEHVVDPKLVEFARPLLPETGRGTVRIETAGKVQFKKAPDSIEIADMAAAVAWARGNAPHAVKQPEPVVLKPELKGLEENFPAGVITLVRGEVKASVDVGVKL